MEKRGTDPERERASEREMASQRHPTPYTLHPAPNTLHSIPYTLHPTHYTLHLTPYTLNTDHDLHKSEVTFRHADGLYRLHCCYRL